MAVRNVIGVVPQDLALYEDLTARENLVFWGQMYGLSGKALNSRVDEVLEQIGLADKAKNRVKTYSGGMKRRVNIGVGLLHKPRLLFMDEPTVGIDPQSRRAILDTVKDLNKQGMTVLYTTHYMEEAQELSDRVGIIDHGELIALGTQEELTQQVGADRNAHPAPRRKRRSRSAGECARQACQDVLRSRSPPTTKSRSSPPKPRRSWPRSSPRPTSAASRSARSTSASRTWKRSSCI
ncbi:MAG: ATP-binding cassette domain-containing protein [Ignavibacteriales bacterium]|nr:ATP-binding cassette domain-containing protein [Ignavibacteriales bacterium]